MAANRKRHRGPFRLLALGVPVALLIAAAEGFLRLSDADGPTPQVRAGEPTVQEPDARLGWRNKAGEYEIAPYTPEADAIHLRFLSRGRRATSALRGDPASPERDAALIVGGSFAQGWAISDPDTFAWKLQDRYPRLQVLNYGTGGYGSYQSLLVLEQELPRVENARFVLYAFTGHHDTRNVAPWHWMRLLSELSKRGHIDVPFATLDERGALVRHPPTRFTPWPLSEQSRAVRFLQRRTLGMLDRLGFGRQAQERPVTEQVLARMNEVSEAHGAQLVVALLSARRDKARHYERFLRQRNIAVIDCNAFPLPREMIVLGEGHPNARMNSRWSSCIGDFLDRELSDEPAN